MTDPNAIYKTGFAELVVKLGRVPTADEALGLHEEYKSAYEYERERNGRGNQESITATSGSVIRPGNTAGGTTTEAITRDSVGFSRQPAPQASAVDSDARTREGEEATGAPDKSAEPEEAVTAPEPVREYPRASEPVLVVASAPCRACGREFERVARRGRPPVKCEECR